VELVEPDTVMVLTTCITTTTGMLAVLANTTVTCCHVATLVPVLLKTGGL